MSTKARRVLGEENVPVHYAISNLPGHKSRHRLSDVPVSSAAQNDSSLADPESVSMHTDSKDTMDVKAQHADNRRLSFYVNDHDSAILDSQTIATPIAGIRTPCPSTALHSHPTLSKPLKSWASNRSLADSAMKPALRRNTPSTPNLSQRLHGTLQRDEHQRPSTAFGSNDALSATRPQKPRLLSMFFSRSNSSNPSKRSTTPPNADGLSPAPLSMRSVSAEQLRANGSHAIKSMSSLEGFTALDSETQSEVSQEQGAAETPVIRGGPSNRYANTRKLSVEECIHYTSASRALDQELYVSDGGIVHERPTTCTSSQLTKSLNADALAKLEASTSIKPSAMHPDLPQNPDNGKHMPYAQSSRSKPKKKLSMAKSVLQEQSFFAFSDSDDNDDDGSVKPEQLLDDQETSPENPSIDDNRPKNHSRAHKEPVTSRWSPSTIPSTAEYPKSNRTSWISSSPTVYHPAASNVESLANSLSSLGANRNDDSHLMAVTSEEAAFLSSMRRKRASIRRHLVNEGYRLAIEQEYRNLSRSTQRSTSRRDNENGPDADADSHIDEDLSLVADVGAPSPATAVAKTTQADVSSSSPPRGRPTSIKITTTARLSVKPTSKRMTAIEGQMWRDVDGDATDPEDDSPIHPTHRRTQGDFAPLNPIISSRLDDSNDDFDDGLDDFISSKHKVHHRKRLSKLLGVSQGTSSSWWDKPNEDEVFSPLASNPSKAAPQVDIIDLEEERRRLARNKKKRRSAAIDVLAAWGDLGGD